MGKALLPDKRSGLFPNCDTIIDPAGKNQERRTAAAPATPAKGHMNSTWPTPPCGGAVQVLRHVQRALRLSWRYLRDAVLDARASSS